MAIHPYGCRVIQRVLEYCNAEQTKLVLLELLDYIEQLVLVCVCVHVCVCMCVCEM